MDENYLILTQFSDYLAKEEFPPEHGRWYINDIDLYSYRFTQQNIRCIHCQEYSMPPNYKTLQLVMGGRVFDYCSQCLNNYGIPLPPYEGPQSILKNKK